MSGANSSEEKGGQTGSVKTGGLSAFSDVVNSDQVATIPDHHEAGHWML